MKNRFRDWLFMIWYWYVNKIDKNAEVLFMNFGYAEKPPAVKLEAKDEQNRYSIQLYHHLVSTIDLKDKDIVEIGCGRGGGLEFITRLFSPATAKGIDIDIRAVDFNNRHYRTDGLSFQQGDAQKIPMDDNTCDAVINVESSHRYPDFCKFLREVYRILRDDGYFLFTDFRYDFEIPFLQKDLKSSGLTLLNEEFITQQVVAALESDDGRRRELVEKLAPRVLQKTALNFAGTIGSETYNRFISGKYIYFKYILQKSNN